MANAKARGANERRGRTALKRRAGTEQADGFIVKKGTVRELGDASGKSGRPENCAQTIVQAEKRNLGFAAGAGEIDLGILAACPPG
jgi:hypothetical protein